MDEVQPGIVNTRPLTKGKRETSCIAYLNKKGYAIQEPKKGSKPKRASSGWNDLVKQAHADLKKKNGKSSLSEAIALAKSRRK